MNYTRASKIMKIYSIILIKNKELQKRNYNRYVELYK